MSDMDRGQTCFLPTLWYENFRCKKTTKQQSGPRSSRMEGRKNYRFKSNLFSKTTHVNRRSITKIANKPTPKSQLYFDNSEEIPKNIKEKKQEKEHNIKSSTRENLVSYEFLQTQGRTYDLIVATGTSKRKLQVLAKHYIQKYGKRGQPTGVNIYDLKEACLNRSNLKYPEEKYFRHWLYQLIQARDGSTTECFPNEM